MPITPSELDCVLIGSDKLEELVGDLLSGAEVKAVALLKLFVAGIILRFAGRFQGFGRSIQKAERFDGDLRDSCRLRAVDAQQSLDNDGSVFAGGVREELDVPAVIYLPFESFNGEDDALLVG